MQEYINYINGSWKEASNSTVPLNDAGFLLGDGLFETIRFDNRKLFYPDKHLKRLYEGLDIIRIKMKKTPPDFTLLLKTIIQQNSLSFNPTIRILFFTTVILNPFKQRQIKFGSYPFQPMFYNDPTACLPLLLAGPDGQPQ